MGEPSTPGAGAGSRIAAVQARDASGLRTLIYLPVGKISWKHTGKAAGEFCKQIFLLRAAAEGYSSWQRRATSSLSLLCLWYPLMSESKNLKWH